MFKSIFTSRYPLWNIHLNSNKTAREFVDERVKKVLDKISDHILNNNYQFIKKKFDNCLLKMHLNYNLIQQINPIVSDLTYYETINKKYNFKNYHPNFFLKKIKINYKIFFQIVKSIFKILYFLNLKNKKIPKKNYSFLVEFFFGLKQKNDFPDLKYFSKEKTLFFFNQQLKPHHIVVKNLLKNKFKHDYITLNKFNKNYIKYKKFELEKISSVSRNVLKIILLNFFKNPTNAYINSILSNFVIDYEMYRQIFTRYNIKIFVHSLSYDKFFAPVRQALNDCDAININYLRSYYTNKINSYLAQPDELIFSWGKYFSKNFDKESNCNKNIFYSKPYFDYLKVDSNFFKYVKRKSYKKKVISIFDTSCYDAGIFSPINYNRIMEYIINYVIKNKELFLIIKYKNPSTKKTFLKKKLISKLEKQNRILEIDTPHFNTSSIYKVSNLVISMNTLSVGAEALYHGTDSLNYVVKSFSKSNLLNFNELYPFAFSSYNEFIKNFKIKIKTKKNKKKLLNLKKFLFNKKESIDSKNFIKYFLKHSKLGKTKKEIITNFKKLNKL